MIVFGIDPGIAITGYCALDIENIDNVSIKTWGSIQTEKNQPVQTRLLEIHEDFKELFTCVQPDVIAIEEVYFFKNAKTIIPVLEARGVIIMTAEMFNLPVYEYTPMVVKQVITGYGRAEKSEVKEMLSKVITLPNTTKLDDVIDAAAIAYCHARQLQ